MLLILEFQRVGTGVVTTRISKALRFVLYLNNIKGIIYEL